MGNGFILAETGGAEEITLTISQIPAHSHVFLATSDAASTAAPAPSETFARALASTITPYGTDAPNVNMSPQMIGSVGGSQPHTNFQPYLCIDFIISLFGIFPSPT
jgi:microcystin-dependent protein